jgi:hypothetical protein
MISLTFQTDREGVAFENYKLAKLDSASDCIVATLPANTSTQITVPSGAAYAVLTPTGAIFYDEATISLDLTSIGGTFVNGPQMIHGGERFVLDLSGMSALWVKSIDSETVGCAFYLV